MLVLTRKVGEIITIGHDVQVKVMAINGEQIKIGVEAPKSLEVHRLEVYNRIHNQAA